MMQAPSLDLVDTEYSACSISACPSDRSIVACGLYQVVKDESAEQVDESSPATKRLGRCLLMQMDDDGKLYVGKAV
jgi:diphthamide biosynthesis protein 7